MREGSGGAPWCALQRSNTSHSRHPICTHQQTTDTVLSVIPAAQDSIWWVAASGLVGLQRWRQSGLPAPTLPRPPPCAFLWSACTRRTLSHAPSGLPPVSVPLCSITLDNQVIKVNSNDTGYSTDAMLVRGVCGWSLFVGLCLDRSVAATG